MAYFFYYDGMMKKSLTPGNGLLGKTWNVCKNTFLLFKKYDMGTLGGALSYYTVFSFAPVIIIVVSVVGFILGPEAVEGELKRQMQGIIGSQSAGLLQDIVRAAYRPGKNIPTAIIAVVFLIIGALSVFGQLRTSLNTLWDVPTKSGRAFLHFLLARLFSFAMVICLAFLLLVSLIIHSTLEGFSDFLQARFQNLPITMFIYVNHILSLAFTWLLFALVYKYMSDAKLPWRNVWWGALFTAVLFTIGKYAIGLYLGKSNISETYGAAGSVVMILIWVFYSSQILFFGAEFTRALAMQEGIELGDSRKPKMPEQK